MLYVFMVIFSTALASTPYETYKSRSSDRWTIANWFETKRQVNLMDQWLSRNRKTKNIFDLDLSLSHLQDEVNTKKFDGSETESNADYYGGEFSFYIYSVGINATYHETEDVSKNRIYSGSAALRLLGTSNQTTRLIVFYGKHFEETALDSWRPNYFGTALTIYITDFLGIEGSYRKYLEEESSLAYLGKGDQKDFSVFVDIYFLRLFTKWSDKELEFNNPSDETREVEHKSFEAGLKFFF
jgi:hypothetical protein